MLRNRPSMYPQREKPRATMYPGAPTGIDFRLELGEILSQYGHWVMVRHYDTSKYSEYWNHDVHEAVGGPAWEWDDHIVRSRKVILRTGGVLSALEMPAPPGIITVPYVSYYLKWDVIPRTPITNRDEIYEFPWDSTRQPGADEVIDQCTTKYNIIEVVDLLGDAGRREYYLCVCKADNLGA